MSHLSLGAIVIIGTLVFGILLAGVLLIYMISGLLVHLKSAQPQLWKSLNLANGRALFRDHRVTFVSFLLFRRYRELGDPKLKKIGDGIVLLICTTILDVVLIIGILWVGIPA